MSGTGQDLFALSGAETTSEATASPSSDKVLRGEGGGRYEDAI